MDTKSWGWVLGVVAIGVIGYFVVMGIKGTPEEPKTPSVESEEEVAAADEGNTSILWEFGIMSEDPELGAPMREVSITYKGVKRVVGSYRGSCSIVEESSWPLVEGELTGVICWYAGGGSEVGVFYEDGKRVVKVGVLEEGTAETEGMRGDFETAFALD